MNIYITGTSGFLGKAVVKDLLGRDSNTKIYAPTRDKKGVSGSDRCRELFGGSVTWVDPKSKLPEDTNVIILSAFDVNFNRPIPEMLEGSVKPMIAILREAHNLPNLKKIAIVSTAYVQPPMPHRKDDEIIFHEDPLGVYEKLIAGEKIDNSKLNPHTTHNSYIFCKTLIEHLVRTDEFKSLPISMVRPSIIGASYDGTQYSMKSPGCLSVFIAFTPFGRFTPWWGLLDYVPVDLVAKRVVDAGLSEKHDRLVYATNGIGYPTTVLRNIMCPNKYIILYPKHWIPFLQDLEIKIFGMLFGKAHLLRLFYDSYNYFSSRVFDFDHAIPYDFNIEIAKNREDHTKWVHVEMDNMKKKVKELYGHLFLSALVAVVSVILFLVYFFLK